MTGITPPWEEAEYLTTDEAAERAGLEAHLLRTAIHKQNLPVKRVIEGSRRRVWIAARDLEDWLRMRQQKRERVPVARGRHSSEWGALVSATRQSRGLPKVELAQLAGISPSYATLVEQGQFPNASTLCAWRKRWA